VYGGLALAVWGEPRETRDADFAVCHADLDGIVGAFEQIGLHPQVNFRAMTFGGNQITRIEVTGMAVAEGFNVVDLVEPRSERFARGVLQRAVSGNVRGQPIRVVSPEDFIVLKVLSTRERDIEDAASVVRALRGRLEWLLIAEEISALALELPDHPCEDRWLRVQREAG